MSDGTIVIDTRIDSSGARRGTRELYQEANRLANEYKRAGMSSSQAWKRAWSEIEGSSRLGTNEVRGNINSISSIAKKCATALGGLFILDKVKDYATEVVKTGISYNAMSEQAQVAWATILGSQSKASQMMKDIEKYAAETPFSKMGVDAMAKQLTNAGFHGKALFDQLTKFGNMGSAFGIQEDSLKEMVRQYSQVQQAQVAYTEDLNILQDRGIPIFKALAEVMGVPVSQVKKLASEGKVTADVYNKAIDSIASHTTGAMENQSKTFSGMMSTLEDNLSMLAGALAKPIFDKMKENLQGLMPKLEEFTTLVGKEGIGNAISTMFPQLKPLVDFFTSIANVLTTVVIPALLNFGGWIASNIGPISFLATTIGGAVLAFKGFMIVKGIVSAFQEAQLAIALFSMNAEGATIAQGAFNGMLTIGETVVALLTGKVTLAALAQEAWNAVMAMNPIGLLVMAIGALVAAFIYFWNTSESFRNFWIGLWDAVKNACITAWNSICTFFTDTIPNAFNSIINFFKSDWKEILLFIVNPFAGAFMLAYKHCDGFRNFINNLVNNIKMFFVNGFNNMKTSVINFATNALLTIQTWGTNVWNFFVVTIPSWITNIFNWFNELPYKIGFALGFVVTKIIMWGVGVWNYLMTNVPIWINNVGTWFSELPGKIWTWLCDSINKVAAWGSEMWDKATTIASQFISDCINYICQLPGKIWNWLCITINKVSAWGSQMWTRAKAIASQFVSDCINYICQLPGKIWTWLCNAVSKVAAWGSNLWNTGKNAALRLVHAVVDTVKSIPGKMISIGRNIVHGVWNGITGAAGWFKSKIHDFFGGIVDGAKSALGIHSPARKMIPIGKYTVEGTEVGMSKQFPKMQEKFKGKVHGLVSDMKAKVQYESISLGSSILSKSNFDIIEKNNDKNNQSDVSGVISSLNKTLKSLDPKIYLDSNELLYSKAELIKNSLDSNEQRNPKFAY
ncbi:TP901 family phage tail tape measure protein [[Clostridium] sordellii]|uniref:tape measure protein n=1 Tax=Paraclostridium sordellii TaxID=1505 RepID=UPI0005E3D7C5|nr:tape measure protein [Paeniclostridium sordellii]CEN81349.1 TP901 family phage tail tape measure protein [[Clostridium] sordellii] [Paeniclostridium sordellii]CEO09389.1 TP901 family phage tail tape measure protein [[Clostridium] sordellii] [Paeniclostridium sordellii]